MLRIYAWFGLVSRWRYPGQIERKKILGLGAVYLGGTRVTSRCVIEGGKGAPAPLFNQILFKALEKRSTVKKGRKLTLLFPPLIFDQQCAWRPLGIQLETQPPVIGEVAFISEVEILSAMMVGSPLKRVSPSRAPMTTTAKDSIRISVF